MSSFKNHHLNYCVERGIKREICNFVNKLVDEPGKFVPDILRNQDVANYLAQKLNLTHEKIYKIAEQTEIVQKIQEGKICDECKFSKSCKFKDLEHKGKTIPLSGNTVYSKHGEKIILRNRVLTKSHLSQPLQHLLFPKAQSSNQANQKDVQNCILIHGSTRIAVQSSQSE